MKVVCVGEIEYHTENEHPMYDISKKEYMKFINSNIEDFKFCAKLERTKKPKWVKVVLSR